MTWLYLRTCHFSGPIYLETLDEPESEKDEKDENESEPVGKRDRSNRVVEVVLPPLLFTSPRLMHMPANLTPDTEITLSFTAQELSQLEAFATLHGVSLSAFVKSAALDAAQIASGPASAATKKSRTPDTGALWMSEPFVGTIQAQENTGDVFPPIDATEELEAVKEAPVPVAKRGVTGEPSKFAKGKGPVWDIRQALGRDRIHGLGWTREQLAFVLKLSVVGVRKMEHLGTSLIKSLEARRKLQGLSKLRENPSEAIASYIEAEEKALG
jgi:hypothetical protein